MKIYTKRGDSGTTGLIGGTRVGKSHVRIESYGAVDELNSFIGALRDQPVCSAYKDFLYHIQDRLFTIGSNLASDPVASKMKLPELFEEDIRELEHSIDEMEGMLPALQNFILPGGHFANSMAHIARCVCRRAERHAVELDHQSPDHPVDPKILAYLNRLSDWLFVFSRRISQLAGAEEILWKPRK